MAGGVAEFRNVCLWLSRLMSREHGASVYAVCPVMHRCRRVEVLRVPRTGAIRVRVRMTAFRDV